MTINILEVHDASGAVLANQSGIDWAVWDEIPVGQGANEFGSNISTNAEGALVIPSVISAGFFYLRVNDTLMGFYDGS